MMIGVDDDNDGGDGGDGDGGDDDGIITTTRREVTNLVNLTTDGDTR